MDERDRKNEPSKVGDKVKIVNDFVCEDEANVGEIGVLQEFEYAINDWWNGENSVDYRVIVKLDRKRIEPIIISCFLSDLRKIKHGAGK